MPRGASLESIPRSHPLTSRRLARLASPAPSRAPLLLRLCRDCASRVHTGDPAHCRFAPAKSACFSVSFACNALRCRAAFACLAESTRSTPADETGRPRCCHTILASVGSPSGLPDVRSSSGAVCDQARLPRREHVQVHISVVSSIRYFSKSSSCGQTLNINRLPNNLRS